MTSGTTTIEQQIRFTVQARTESQKPAVVKEDDQPISISTDSGDGVGAIENISEYAENGITGTQFDVVLKSTTPGASTFTVKADADNDAGEVREITTDFNLTTNALEASALSVSTGVTEPIA